MKIADALRGVRRLFLDTSPVIYHVEGSAAYQPLTDVVFQEISSGAFEGVTSPITLAECLVQPYQKGDLALIQQFRQVITSGTHTHYMTLDTVADRPAELRARYNLSLTDAFQIAAALGAVCDAFLTNSPMIKVSSGCRKSRSLCSTSWKSDHGNHLPKLGCNRSDETVLFATTWDHGRERSYPFFISRPCGRILATSGNAEHSGILEKQLCDE